MPQFLVFILFFAGVYFLLLRPQQQRVRRQRELITAIGVGDRVVTAGGLIGRVIDESDDRLLLEIADGVVVEFLRLAISRRLDESESSFLSLSDNAELEGGYEEESPEQSEDADKDEEPLSTIAEAAALPAEAVLPDVAPTAASHEEHPAVTPAPPVPGAPGASKPDSDQDSH